MRKIKNAVFTEDKRILFSIIGISVFMLLISLFNVDFTSVAISISFNSYASLISVIPLSILVSTVMLMKTKKSNFGEFPQYIISLIIAMLFILLYVFEIFKGVNLFLFALCILMIYPYIIAGITIRGYIYNRVFALIFAGILLILSVAAVIAAGILLSGFSLTYLILPLMYVVLILNILCFRLEPIKKNKPDSEYTSII